MADTSLFNRLKRLFSTQAVVRNIGGKKLKISDTSRIQAFSTRNSVDRYKRVYRAGQYGYAAQSNYDTNSSYQQARLQLFRDYDLMDADPIVASVLDIYADESTVKNEYGQILEISSDNDRITDTLENLFYDILNIEFNLWPWTRNMCKYGDFYLYLMLDPEYGIVNVIPLSVYETQRMEGEEDGSNPFYVKFKVDNQYSFLPKDEFENFEVAHFRMLSDSNFLPYGKSMIENGRRIHKQLRLMEDAMLIHRVSRAPDKRVFQIDVGNIPPNEVEAYMEKIANEMKREPLVDRNTGDFNMKYNMQNILEDFFIPVRGQDNGNKIETLQGLQFNAIEDVEYLLHKLLAAFKVPKSFIGYEEDTSGKATLASQDVRFARTIERIQRILVSELNKIALVHLYINGFRDEELVNFKLSLTNPSTVYEIEKINLWKEKAQLADQFSQGKYMSREWVYKNVFNLSDEEITIEMMEVAEDAKFEGNLQKITTEAATPEPPPGAGPEAGMGGVPPATAEPMPETDEDPSDNDDLFGAEDAIDSIDKLVKKAQNGKPMGRPPEGKKIGTDADDRGRDPLGYKEILHALDIMPKQKQDKKRTYMSPRIEHALESIKGMDGFESLGSETNKDDEQLLSE